jgi:hypothetical protein
MRCVLERNGLVPIKRIKEAIFGQDGKEKYELKFRMVSHY